MTLKTDNVEIFRLLFNDQMLDLSKPVTIVANGRARFHDLLTPSLSDMLKDQLFLGRGWRYFSAAVELDLTGAPLLSSGPTEAAPTAPHHHGTITIYNADGSVQKVIQTPGD